MIEFTLDRPDDFENPMLSGLYDTGFPVFEIRITVDDRAVHSDAGAIRVILSDSSFRTIPDLRVIHVLSSGDYREEAHTLDGESLSITLSSLSHVCVLDGAAVRELLKNPFSDVFEDDWYYDNVLFVSRMGLMSGIAPEMFCSILPMSRAMAVTVIYRISGDTGNYANAFSDVLAGSWYEKAVAWAAAKGISDGVDENTFAPETNITREQLAAMRKMRAMMCRRARG
ncbi:MAG: S-layer homology domain-containing protein [Clostridiales bacterium]|nr:S-layer homology domain-containing protein [Clostridiales bacterium]